MERTLLSFAAELNTVFNRILDKHQKAWEIGVPEKITVTFIMHDRSRHPYKVIVVTNDNMDVMQPARG